MKGARVNTFPNQHPSPNLRCMVPQNQHFNTPTNGTGSNLEKSDVEGVAIVTINTITPMLQPPNNPIVRVTGAVPAILEINSDQESIDDRNWDDGDLEEEEPQQIEYQVRLSNATWVE